MTRDNDERRHVRGQLALDGRCIDAEIHPTNDVTRDLWCPHCNDRTAFRKTWVISDSKTLKRYGRYHVFACYQCRVVIRARTELDQGGGTSDA